MAFFIVEWSLNKTAQLIFSLWGFFKQDTKGKANLSCTIKLPFCNSKKERSPLPSQVVSSAGKDATARDGWRRRRQVSAQLARTSYIFDGV